MYKLARNLADKSLQYVALIFILLKAFYNFKPKPTGPRIIKATEIKEFG